MTTTTIAQEQSPLAILLIEDEPVDAHIVESNLRKGGADAYELRHVETLADARDELERRPADVVLMDLHLTDATGVDAVREIIECSGDASVIALTGLGDKGAAMKALGFGAHDYLVKGEFTSESLRHSIQFATERQRLRRATEQINKRESELKDMFLSHVSHELRTPLTAIVQFVSILRDEVSGPVNGDQRRYLDIVTRNADQLGRMVTTLMDATRAASGKMTCEPRRVPVAKLCQQAIESVRLTAEASELTLELAESHDGAVVVADPARILQVLLNLLGNAIKFTPAGGRVRLCVRRKERDVLFAVEDTGRGMSPEDLERVFDRLYQTGDQGGSSRNGLGLGLHISREIVRLHDGNIWATSELGTGSTFHFSLPRWSLVDAVRSATAVGGRLDQGLVLVRVDVRPVRAQAVARGVESAARATIDLLERCLYGGRDYVVPLGTVGEEEASVFALARADREGARAIARRLEQEVRDDDRLGAAGYRGKVCEHWFDPSGGDGDVEATIAAWAEQVAKELV